MDTAIPIEPPATISPIPKMPSGTPTLARHLEWALRYMVEQCRCELSDSDLVRFEDARVALAALPLVAPAVRSLNGTDYMSDNEGRLVPLGLVRPAKLLEDDYVRTVAQGALSVSSSITRFAALSFSEGQALLDTLADCYKVKLGGRKGNVEFRSFDGEFKVEISSQERITFGPSIEIAKQLLFEWLGSEDASEDVKAVVGKAFQLDDQKQLRITEILRLRRFDVKNPKWKAAMDVIAEAMEAAGSKEYLRVYRRDDHGYYKLIPLALSSVGKVRS